MGLQDWVWVWCSQLLNRVSFFRLWQCDPECSLDRVQIVACECQASCKWKRYCQTLGAYRFKKSGNFGWKSNGTGIFWKIPSEIIIVDNLQRYSSFSLQSGTMEISLPFAQFPSSSLSSTENSNRKPNFKW